MVTLEQWEACDRIGLGVEPELEGALLEAGLPQEAEYTLPLEQAAWEGGMGGGDDVGYAGAEQFGLDPY